MNFLSRIFGFCPHTNTSWPWSRIDQKRCEPYVVCLDCSKKIPYPLDLMSRRIA